MNKLEMAHQMACAMMASNDGYTIGGAIECAWEYADAMQKEWDERNHVGSSDEWQPDWSQAPDDVEYWRVSEIRGPEWVSVEDGISWYRPAPLFDYQGDWKDSLRKRP